MTEWTRDRFSRRRYTVEGDSLDRAKRIELIVKIDGKTLVQMEAREPGMLAFVSRPADQGFDIDVVEPTGKKFVDYMMIGAPDEGLADWQLEALGLKGE